MAKVILAGGTVHTLPADMKKALLKSRKASAAWADISPLARNEWICWTTTVKQATRENHIKRTVSELEEGTRRPCCWVGCIHRTDKALSPSVKWALSKKNT
jgi:uncharacterized protein YdeI (YjbR/CyaY-like superfamily)